MFEWVLGGFSEVSWWRLMGAELWFHWGCVFKAGKESINISRHGYVHILSEIVPFECDATVCPPNLLLIHSVFGGHGLGGRHVLCCHT